MYAYFSNLARFYWYKDVVYSNSSKDYFEVDHVNVNNFLQETHQKTVVEKTDIKIQHLLKEKMNINGTLSIDNLINNIYAAEKGKIITV